MNVRRHPFNPQEWAMLSGALGLAVADGRGRDDACDARALLNPQHCRALLARLMPALNAPSLKITASLLSKRIAFLTTASSLYAMSMYNKGLDMSLPNCMLEYGHAGQRWTSGMPLYDLSISAAPDGAMREAWRTRQLQQLFAGHLTPLWRSFSAVTGISPRILWENTAVRIFSLYERRMLVADGESAALSQRIQQDFDYLVHQAPGAVFGGDDNPLTAFFRAKTWVPTLAKAVRFRRTCCFYYKASQPREYCAACPLLRPKRNDGDTEGGNE